MNLILTKVNTQKPMFKDLVGLKWLPIDENTKILAASIHKNATLVESEDKKELNVCTSKALYVFKNLGNKYILRIGSPTGTPRKKWFRIS